MNEEAVKEEIQEILDEQNQSMVQEVTKEKPPQSPYNGVSFFKGNKKWSAKVLLNKDENGKRKLKHIGYFTNDKDAAIARNEYIEANGLTCKKSRID